MAKQNRNDSNFDREPGLAHDDDLASDMDLDMTTATSRGIMDDQSTSGQTTTTTPKTKTQQDQQTKLQSKRANQPDR